MVAWNFSKEFCDLVIGLGDFSTATLKEWTKAAAALALDPNHRSTYIPKAWDDAHVQQNKAAKKRGSHGVNGKNGAARKKIADAMKTICPENQ